MKTALSGIKPTGTPHLGNYFGAIKPALELVKDHNPLYFIADLHALNSIRDPKLLKNYTYEVATTWLSCGLDHEKVLFYCQSDIPEISELAVILNNFTPKGLMNRAHAYKAEKQVNINKGFDEDRDINLGLFTYPILMAADILLFNSEIIPVGQDQKQHIEIVSDIAHSFNHQYKQNVFKIPEAKIIQEQHIQGIDGRKMSKSYNNTIPLFSEEKKLRKTIMRIQTNSQGVEEKKDPEICYIYKLYKLFANPLEQKELSQKYLAGGMGWGEAKQILFEKINSHFENPRLQYKELINNTKKIDTILQTGAKKASIIAKKNIQNIKEVLGFRT